MRLQSYDDSDVERPFLLKPPPGRRCEVCLDMVASPATLYGTLVRHCTVECWLKSKGAAADLEWANAIVREEFSAEGANAFCVTCASGFRRGKACHDGHVVFSVEGGMRPRVRIPGGHSIARALDSVKVRYSCLPLFVSVLILSVDEFIQHLLHSVDEFIQHLLHHR